MDRTVATGTGYVDQYRPPVAKMYESLNTTPDALLLFFHHVPYTYVLDSERRSSSTSTIRTTRARSLRQVLSSNGKRSKAAWMKSAMGKS